MKRQVRVILMLLVWVNLTLTCQGHDVDRHHSGVHIALLGDHDEAEQVGQSTASTHTSHQEMEAALFAIPLDDESMPSDARTCMVGPLSGTPEGGDILTTGAGETTGTPAQFPAFNLYDAPGEVPFLAQAISLPEKPPPRGTV